MTRRMVLFLFAGTLVVGAWAATAAPAKAQSAPLNRYYYYPYYYFPHNYWPSMGPKWPEQPGQPPMRAPAYMAYPPFREPQWRYEMWEPQRFYRGSHFWLDQF
jgi:hypothetical protein